VPGFSGQPAVARFPLPLLDVHGPLRYVAGHLSRRLLTVILWEVPHVVPRYPLIEAVGCVILISSARYGLLMKNVMHAREGGCGDGDEMGERGLPQMVAAGRGRVAPGMVALLFYREQRSCEAVEG